MRSYQLVVQWSAAESTIYRICYAASISLRCSKNLDSKFSNDLMRKQGSPDLAIKLTKLNTCSWYLRARRNPLMTRVRYNWKGSLYTLPPIMCIIYSVSLKCALSNLKLLAGEMSKIKPKSMCTKKPFYLSTKILPLWRSFTCRM